MLLFHLILYIFHLLLVVYILATSVSQRLVRKLCPHCAQERSFTEEEIEKMQYIGKNSAVSWSLISPTRIMSGSCLNTVLNE